MAATESYVRQLDANHSVRIIVQSVQEERNAIRRGAWRRGLCTSLCGGGDGRAGCTSTCFLPLVCPCVPFAQVAARIGVWSYCGTLLFVLVLHLLRIACITELVAQQESATGQRIDSTHSVIAVGLLLASSVFMGVAVFVLRWRVRSQFEIPGSACCDIFVSCFFWCCAIGQMAGHVKVADSRGCCSEPDVLPGFEPSS